MNNRLINKMQIFVSFEDVESEFDGLIEEGLSHILFSETKNGTRPWEDVIFDYVSHSRWEDRLKTIVGLSGGSLERLRRIHSSISPEMSFNKIGTDEKARKIISSFLANPDCFSDRIPRFIRKCFYLRKDWVNQLKDRDYVESLVRNNLLPKYAVRIGLAQEKNIISAVEKLGLNWQKGKVEIVDNKEVDVAIPDIENPEILIMSSYALTTASSQSSRANEQTLMYDSIQLQNRRKNKNIKLINIIDGGGWLDRANDLRKIVKNSDETFCNLDLQDGTFVNYIANLTESRPQQRHINKAAEGTTKYKKDETIE